jgi:predicted nucleic acid-binding protein
MLVVADTSALLALAACESLPLLDALFQEVRVPSAVFEECTVAGKPFSDELRTYLQDRVTTVDLTEFVIAAVGLGAGELEAMALYKHLRADRLLVDDQRARRIATFNHIEVIGCVGVLLLAKNRNLIPAVKPKLDSMQTSGIRLSEALFDAALRIADEA